MDFLQMTDHFLNPVKGWWDEHALDFTAALSANVTISPFPAGRVVHLNADKEFETGATGHDMPMFIFQGSGEFDVARDSSTKHGVQGMGGGKITALVATGGYEVQSTEYDHNQDYASNDLLRGQFANTVAATGGVLTNQGITLHTNCVCGIVSVGVVKQYGVEDCLTFWTVFLPGSGA